MFKDFTGFKTVKELKSQGVSSIPQEKGVYVVLRKNLTAPEFLSESIGGHFKGRNPTVSIAELNDNWVDNEEIVYIGQAGGKNSKATLRKRISSYIKYGSGKPVGHQGGRYIWQLKDSDELLFVWKVTKEDPDLIETKLIDEFKKKHNKRPFANLKK